MHKCKNCNSRFGWSKIFKSFWWIYKPIECVNCGTKHKIIVLGRSTVTALTLIPMWIFLFFLSPFDKFFTTLSLGILIAIVGLLLSPYVVQYKKEVY